MDSHDCPGASTLSCDVLGNACFCLTLDRARLQAEARRELQDPHLADLLDHRWVHAFADLPVFVAAAQLRRMAAVVAAVEAVVARPGWRERAMAAAPEIARHDPRGAKGVFMGYDFHVDGGALGLIEINTNAGGALLNTLLARAQRACCDAMEQVGGPAPVAAAETFEAAIVGMFEREWKASGTDRPLRCIAIVDRDPPGQYLYPEFLLFRRLFARHGIETLVADPGALSFGPDGLRHGATRIDLVYNRLTDFYLQEPDAAALRQAYLQDAVVLTPHPQAHALYADKSRLAWLSDEAMLQELGVPAATRDLLAAAIPRAVPVTSGNAEQLWRERRRLFFKPVHGFGGKAAYRGDKLTRSAWSGVVAGGYIAQALVAPGTRRLGSGDNAGSMKFDLRNYAYEGQVQWVAARLYQGQVTNFRTEGGGFAPVHPLSESREAAMSAEEYASYVFLLDDAGAIRPLPHQLYVALARAQATSPPLAGQRVRVADWHVRLRQGQPDAIVREWYGWAQFDSEGAFDPAAARRPGPVADPARGNVDTTAFPSEEERRRMLDMVFKDGATGVAHGQ